MKLIKHMPDLPISKETEVEDLTEFVDLKELTLLTQEALSEMYGDPEEDSYYTPQQLKRISISRMVEENEIWGTIDQNNILRLECDSDTFRLAIEWVINLDTKEVFIHD